MRPHGHNPGPQTLLPGRIIAASTPVTIELINTGSELMLGRVLNTHQQWICRTLADRGRVVDRQVAISDAPEVLVGAVRDALGRSDWVITTGGLGPTCDDRTRDLVAGLLGRTLVHHPEVEAAIRAWFETRNRAVPQRTRVESLIPEGAEVLTNRHGTAPGLAIWLDPNPFRPGGTASWLVMLPGPPRELRPMFLEEVLPRMSARFPIRDGFACRTLKTTGLGESYMEERLEAPLRDLVEGGMDLGFCARTGEVDVRFVARGDTAVEVVTEAERRTRGTVGEHIFGVEDDTLEQVLVREFTLRSLTLGLAESCTGGHIANRVTDIPGASAVLKAGVVSYSNASKASILGVDEQLLAVHGAVSEPVARAMAEGVRRVTGADYGLSITGIAGPDGEVPGKPVGTVFMAVAGPGGTEVARHQNVFDRQTFKYVTAQQAMALLLRLAKISGTVQSDGRS